MNLKHLVLASSLFITPVSALAYDIGVGLKTGTAGTGMDISMTITQKLNIRLSLTSTDYDFDGESFEIGDDGGNKGTVTADINMSFGSTALLLDWYIFDGTFHLTGGFLKNDGAVDITGTISGDVDLNGNTYTDGQISNFGGSISAGESYEPYLGIGWGRKAAVEKGISLSVELGVVLMDPKASLTATSSVHDIDADIKTAESDINSDLTGLEMFPILSVGLNYAF